MTNRDFCIYMTFQQIFLPYKFLSNKYFFISGQWIVVNFFNNFSSVIPCKYLCELINSYLLFLCDLFAIRCINNWRGMGITILCCILGHFFIFFDQICLFFFQPSKLYFFFSSHYQSITRPLPRQYQDLRFSRQGNFLVAKIY